MLLFLGRLPASVSITGSVIVVGRKETEAVSSSGARSFGFSPTMAANLRRKLVLSGTPPLSLPRRYWLKPDVPIPNDFAPSA